MPGQPIVPTPAQKLASWERDSHVGHALTLCCSPLSTCWRQSREPRPWQTGLHACLLSRRCTTASRIFVRTRAEPMHCDMAFQWWRDVQSINACVHSSSCPALDMPLRPTDVCICVFQVVEVACKGLAGHGVVNLTQTPAPRPHAPASSQAHTQAAPTGHSTGAYISMRCP